MSQLRALWLGGLMACSPLQPELNLPNYVERPSEDDSTPYEDDVPLTDADGACGDTHYVDMTLSGYVIDADWQPVADQPVWLEERNWTPLNNHGETVTDKNGRYELDLTDLPIVEGCWGIGPQFFVASADDTRICEVPANMQLVIAWLDGTLVADISGYPCVLEEDGAL